MRVHVSLESASISTQILAYAEYRLFAVLARYVGVRDARVVLRDEAEGGVHCSVTINFETAASTRTSAKGVHPAAAIDGAAERVVGLMRRRCQPEITPASS